MICGLATETTSCHLTSGLLYFLNNGGLNFFCCLILYFEIISNLWRILTTVQLPITLTQIPLLLTFEKLQAWCLITLNCAYVSPKSRQLYHVITIPPPPSQETELVQRCHAAHRVHRDLTNCLHSVSSSWSQEWGQEHTLHLIVTSVYSPGL